jgi:hypothetical protein
MSGDQTLKDGTWIRSKVPVGDTGDYNERTAEAGALAKIERIGGSGENAQFSVVFWPTFITNFWDHAEVVSDAEILPDNHPDIPSEAEYDFASGVADIVADGEVDHDENTVTAPVEVVERILAGAKEGRYAGNPEVAKLLGEGGEEVTLSFEEFDRLAEIAGVGDRLSSGTVPQP